MIKGFVEINKSKCKKPIADFLRQRLLTSSAKELKPKVAQFFDRLLDYLLINDAARCDFENAFKGIQLKDIKPDAFTE